MQVCSKCYMIYRHTHHMGKHCNCGGDIVDIDKFMIPPCIDLWEKGYWTTNSCEGHFTDKDYSSPYLIIHAPINKVIKDEIPNISSLDGIRYEYWYMPTQAEPISEITRYSVVHHPDIGMADVTRAEVDNISEVTSIFTDLLNFFHLSMSDFCSFHACVMEDIIELGLYFKHPMFRNYDTDIHNERLDSSAMMDLSLASYKQFIENKRKIFLALSRIVLAMPNLNEKG